MSVGAEVMSGVGPSEIGGLGAVLQPVSTSMAMSAAVMREYLYFVIIGHSPVLFHKDAVQEEWFYGLIDFF